MANEVVQYHFVCVGVGCVCVGWGCVCVNRVEIVTINE